VKTAAIVVWAIILGVVVGSGTSADSARNPGPRVGGSGTIGPVCADKHTGQMFYIKLMQLPCKEGREKIYFHVNSRRGPKGPRGLRGKAGPAGAQGPAGATGAQGPTGTGTQGPPGPKGATGVAGPSGTTGPAGATGPQGPTGAQGTTGPTAILCVSEGNNVKWGGLTGELCDPGHDTLLKIIVLQITPPSP